MDSGKFFFVFTLFLLFFSVNVFAGYKFNLLNAEITTIANADGGPDGPSPLGLNAYYSKGPAGNGSYALSEIVEDNPNPDWIELEFTLENVSTDPINGDPALLNSFDIDLASWLAFYPSLRVSYTGTGDPYTTRTGAIPSNSNGSAGASSQITFKVPIELNHIYNTIGFYEIHEIHLAPLFPGGNRQNPENLIDLSTGDDPDMEVFDNDWVLPPPGDTSIRAYLDPINCIDLSSGCTDLANPACTATGTGGSPNDAPFRSDPIRCDLVDSNTISYEIMVEDVNAAHIQGGPLYSVVTIVDLSCSTFSLEGNRTEHHLSGCASGVGCSYEGIWYNGFTPSCELMHYSADRTNWPPVYSSAHNDCVTDVHETAFSVPPLNIPIDDCVIPFAPGCPEQDKNIFYNTNMPGVSKYLVDTDTGLPSSPDLNFTLRVGDRKVIKGTVTNAMTGGDFRCHATVYYDLYNGVTRISPGSAPASIFGLLTRTINDGSNQRLYDGAVAGSYYSRVLKLKGHDAYVIKDGSFMPSSSYIRPLTKWIVNLPIKNTGDDWDGKDDSGSFSEKDILYADVNIVNDIWTKVDVKTLVLDGSDADHTLNSYDIKNFNIPFDITEGLYHQFLTAASMNAKLYDYKGWIFDLTPDTGFNNVRLITVLNPIMYEVLGNECYTEVKKDKLCWWNYINYSLNPLDLNANHDVNFILRLKNPFDFSEHFALTYETNDPGNARLDFVPDTVFVPPFTSGAFGYRYSKMILRNPEILRGDANYNIIDTSVNHPFVWDNLDAQFRTFTNNLKVLSFDLNVNKDCYDLGEELDFSLVIKNEGDRDAFDVNFMVVSSMDSTVIFHAGSGIDIAAGATQEVTGTLPVVPFKGVFVVEGKVIPMDFEFDLSDNFSNIYLSTCYKGNISNLPETNYLSIILAVIFVLIVVRKK